MGNFQFSSPARLSDQELLAKITSLAAEERQATALLIAHLAELDARRLYLAEGYSSLFSYCTQALHLSEYAAYSRIQAARALREFPALLELLSEGALTLTTVGLLAPHLTAQNQEELLRSSRFRSKRQVEEIVASFSPTASAPTILRRLPAPRPESGLPLRSDNEGVPMTLGSQEEERAATPAAQLARNNARSAMVISLGAERYKVQFTASKETYETLRHVRNLMRHQIPDGDLDQIIQRALTALLNDLAKQKVAATEHPSQRRRPTAMNSRHIPAEVRRKVWLRDGGQCTFVGRKGRRCPEVGFLEFHHVRPYADGGGATEENIQLRCRAHNAYEAELWFGPRFSQAVTGPESFNSVRTEFG